MDRPRSGGNALDEMPQAGGPRPQRLAFLVDFPYLAFLGPSLETLRRPIVAEQLQDAVRAVELDGRAAILLHREAGGDAGKSAVTEIEQHLRIVVRLDGDLDAFGHAFRDRRADHRAHAPHGSHEAAETHQVIDAEIEKGSAARAVVPLPPPGAGPSIACASEHDFADFSRDERRHAWPGTSATARCAERRPEGPSRSLLTRSSSRAAAMLVAIGFSTRTCLPAWRAACASSACSFMLVSTRTASTSSRAMSAAAVAGVAIDGCMAATAAVLSRSMSNAAVSRACPLLLELANQLAIRPQKDATESKYAESKHVSVPLIERLCNHSGRCHG